MKPTEVCDSARLPMRACLCRRTERKYRDLWRTVESKRNADCADATIDVELQLANAEPSLDVLSSKRRQDKSAQKWKTNLTSMAVAAEHQVNGLSGWMSQQTVSIVRGMTEQNDGLAANR